MRKKLFRAATLFICHLLLLSLFSCGEDVKNTKTVFAMDTVMTLTAYGKDTSAALDTAAKTIRELDKKLSYSGKESEVYKLNSSGGKPVKADDDLLTPLKVSLDVSEKSGGALDVTVFPVVKAWGFISKEYTVPTDNKLASLLKNVDWSSVKISEDSVSVPENAEIDLGAVAKGYASERAAETLISKGVKSAVISLGGNVRTVGTKPDGSKWNVAVVDPTEPGTKTVGTLKLGETSVVTSGGYQRYFEKNGKRYHHIIDPKTGRPAESGLISVTVVCDDGTYADALSTALFVLGLDKAMEYYREYGGFEAVFITDDKKITVTDGLVSAFTVSDDSGFEYAK
ncbi:MAG: FAD:protein FMN transferase [Clostridiales bacterium]|nr:FAD:protein FMN transferase [Clostridiales bacterium]